MKKESNHTNLTSRELDFFVVEAYKTIRTNLQFAVATVDDNVIITTSYEPNAGKSLTTSNIAITMAQTGAHVLLIDADMRSAIQHKIFGVPNTDGLSRLLSGLSKPEDGIFRKNIRTNLDLLTAGPVPPNPSELLGSKNMGRLLDAMRKVYDYIFIDCPPVGIISDAMSIAMHARSFLFIVRQRQSRKDDVSHAMEGLKSIGAKILGVVVTDAEGNQGIFPGKYGKYGKYSDTAAGIRQYTGVAQNYPDDTSGTD